MSQKFQFKQFSVTQDDSAFKVGTDGVLLGAWTQVLRNGPILEIGTGTGVIALMLAQRCDNTIHAIEAEEKAAAEARNNFQESPWSKQIELFHTTFQDFLLKSTDGYDMIVSNPPYFTNATKSGDSAKNMARHTDSLSFEELAEGIIRLLNPEGRAAIVLPVEGARKFVKQMRGLGYGLERLTRVLPTEDGSAIRWLMEFKKGRQYTRENQLVIETAHREYTEAFKALHKDYLLAF